MKHINKKVMQFFSALADETRLRILLSLAESPKNVNAIYEGLGRDKMTLSAVSHQLRQMSDIEIIECQKKGREKIFRLSDNFCWCILDDAFSHFHGKQPKCPTCAKLKGRGGNRLGLGKTD